MTYLERRQKFTCDRAFAGWSFDVPSSLGFKHVSETDRRLLNASTFLFYEPKEWCSSDAEDGPIAGALPCTSLCTLSSNFL